LDSWLSSSHSHCHCHCHFHFQLNLLHRRAVRSRCAGSGLRSSIGLDGAACYLLDMCAALIVLLPAVVLSSLSNRTHDKGPRFPAEVQSVYSSDLSFFSSRFSFRGKLGGGSRTRARWQAGQGRAMRKSKSKKQKGSWESVCSRVGFLCCTQQTAGFSGP
jgi:hypothetical protein